MTLENLKYYKTDVSKNQKVTHLEADMCIYGGSSAGIAVAIQAKRMGIASVVIVEPTSNIGGMTTSGLGATDAGSKHAVGGLSKEFYELLGNHYDLSNNETQWTFEPHIAEKIYKEWLDNENVEVYTNHYLMKVEKEGSQIKEIITDNGSAFRAKMFFDATYEGDLFAKSSVSYHVGRESNHVYKETLNGVHFGHPNHNFKTWIDPYVVKGDPVSGLLSGIVDEEIGYQGKGDNKIQAYNFRICLTNAPNNMIPYPEPDNYDPLRYELLLRYIESGIWDTMNLHTAMPNQKTDLNNFGAVSTDHIGMNYEWPEGDYHTRERIFQDHVSYNLGMLYFLSNDKRVPIEIRKEVSQWGLPADEFIDTGGWPHHLYIREGRRMVSDYVMTEHNCRSLEVVEDSIGLASYTIDSHNCRRIVIDGRCINEGNVEIPVSKPFPISYRSIVPKAEECTNLLVPVCLSSSHIAYGSIRMEPVFMILGQSAAIAATIALEKDCDVQAVDYNHLKKKLIEYKQILY